MSEMLIIFLLVKSIDAMIYAYPPMQSNLSLSMYHDIEADFGTIPVEGISGVLDLPKPLNACKPLQPLGRKGLHFSSVFALIEESPGCLYSKQVLNAQKAGYKAAIVYRRVYDGVLVTMNGDGPVIAAVYIRKSAGDDLKGYLYKSGAIIKIVPNPPLPLQLYLVPFAVVVGVCFFFMIIFSVGRYVRYYLRERRSRLSPANLKKIPTKKFKKGDDYDVCAICIEDYETNDKIRILPCNHAYHCKCVDPWLTSGKKLCPVCKQPVETKHKKNISINHGEGGSSNPNTDAEEDETTPLLSSQRSVQSSGAISA